MTQVEVVLGSIHTCPKHKKYSYKKIDVKLKVIEPRTQDLLTLVSGRYNLVFKMLINQFMTVIMYLSAIASI